MDHYQTLGVSNTATAVELKSAYRRMVKQYHPDVNATDEARVIIRQLTEAYEVLSDEHRRYIYDHQLAGIISVPQESEVDERELQRRAYRRKKAEEERLHIERLFLLKIKFYKIQRWSCYAFLVLGFVFTIDYFILGEPVPVDVRLFELRGPKSDRYTRIAGTGFSFSTDPELYYQQEDVSPQKLQIYFSSIFHIPARVGAKPGHTFQVYHTLHTFNNFFSYLLIFISTVVILQRRYYDWALTLAIIPFFIAGFLILFIFGA
ncbi:MAG: DnaJ domain-containing protein [Cyclobacteriaceae bacterium]|nr:DnaJ domain-containing protein [Cyclobacteriaceae bacterium HetDA_MAG_MS6]